MFQVRMTTKKIVGINTALFFVSGHSSCMLDPINLPTGIQHNKFPCFTLCFALSIVANFVFSRTTPQTPGDAE